MRVFLTGGTGYVGGHIVLELTRRGHKVTALTRRAKPQNIEANVDWVVGELKYPEHYEMHLSDCDVIIHTAMEYCNGKEVPESDYAAYKAFLKSGKRIIYTGNLFSCPQVSGQPIKEKHFPAELLHSSSQSEFNPYWRNIAENELLSSSDNTAIVRLGFVYGGKSSHFWEILPADQSARLICPDTYDPVWPMIHVDDVVALYMALVEGGGAGVFHAAPDNHTPIRTVVEKSAAGENKQTVFLSDTKSGTTQGGKMEFLTKSVQALNERSRSLGWKNKRNFESDQPPAMLETCSV